MMVVDTMCLSNGLPPVRDFEELTSSMETKLVSESSMCMCKLRCLAEGQLGHDMHLLDQPVNLSFVERLSSFGHNNLLLIALSECPLLETYHAQ